MHARRQAARFFRCCRQIAVIGAVATLAACSSRPSSANIKLRGQVQNLRSQVALLQSQRAGDLASMAAMKSPGTQPAQLAGADADALFTTHGIRIGRLSGGADLDPTTPGEDGLKVYITPVDETGDDFKAAGSITIEAFDLAAEHPEIGRWSFTPQQAKQFWNGQAILYEYILPCPWQNRPAHSDITIKVTFVDLLTGRSFTEQKVTKVHLAGQ